MAEFAENREAQHKELFGLLMRDANAAKEKAFKEFGWNQHDLDKFGMDWIYGLIVADPEFAVEAARFGIWSQNIFDTNRNREAVRQKVHEMIQMGDDIEVARQLADEAGVAGEFDELS